MGEWVSCWIRVAEKDVPKLKEDADLLGSIDLEWDSNPQSWSESPSTEKGVVTIHGSANYGGCDDFAELARKGLVFEAWHNYGCEFMECLMVGYGEKYYEAVCGPWSEVMIEVYPDGSIKEEHMFVLREFLWMGAVVTEHFKEIQKKETENDG